jgi:hypothetical protein
LWIVSGITKNPDFLNNHVDQSDVQRKEGDECFTLTICLTQISSSVGGAFGPCGPDARVSRACGGLTGHRKLTLRLNRPERLLWPSSASTVCWSLLREHAPPMAVAIQWLPTLMLLPSAQENSRKSQNKNKNKNSKTEFYRLCHANLQQFPHGQDSAKRATSCRESWQSRTSQIPRIPMPTHSRPSTELTTKQKWLPNSKKITERNKPTVTLPGGY